MTTEDDLIKRVMAQLQQQQGAVPQQPQPQVAQPDYKQQYYLQAQDVEKQAVPPPQPQGFKQNAMAGIQNFATAFMNPSQYPEIQLQKQQQERQREQDLLGRAKELRGQGNFEAQQQRLEEQNQGLRDYQTNQANAQERRFQEEMAFKKHEAEAPKFSHFGTATGGEIYGQVGPDAKFTQQGEIKPATKADTVPHNTTQADGRVKQYNPATQRYDIDVGAIPERQAVYGEPVVSIFDPVSGQNKLVKRSEAAGQTAPQPASVLKETRDIESSAFKIDKLEKSYSPDFVGPVQGTFMKVKSKLPSFGGLNNIQPGYGEFLQNQADLKNSVVKLITGAQMGQQEAARILQQVPVETDRPEIWEAKFKQTKQNVQMMEGLLQRQIGGTQQQPASNVITTSDGKKWTRQGNNMVQVP